MRESWIPKEEELTLIAATVPLLASLAVVNRADGQPAAAWRHGDGAVLDVVTLARVLPHASGAMGPGGGLDLAVTLTSSSQSVVIVGLGSAWVVVFGFREPVSYDWASYYVRRAMGLLKRREA